jgi:beta-glucosidase
MQVSSVEVDDGRESSEKMKKLCRNAAAESAVLLKNDNVLPVGNNKIALFGRTQFDTFLTGYGSGGDVKATYRTNIAEGIARSGINYDEELMAAYEKWTQKHKPYMGFWGFWPLSYEEMPVSDYVLKKSSEAAEIAVYVIGRATGEDRDNKKARGGWYLTKSEEKLLARLRKHFKKICVLLNVASVMDMSWVEKYSADAVMYIWQGGQETGDAVADLLSGAVSPCGKLPDTVAAYEDYPSSSNYGRKKCTRYAEDIYVGYRYFQTFAPEKAVYPFGFGLSYTRFKTEVLSAKFGEIRVKVTNTGQRAGRETVQLYCKPPQGKLGKPARVLTDFKKTKKLMPKESQELVLTFDEKSIASFDDTGKVKAQAFFMEAGEYDFYVGGDVASAERAYVFKQNETKIIEQLEEVCAIFKPFSRMINDRGLKYEPIPAGKSGLVKERVLNDLPAELNPPESSFAWDDVLSGKAELNDFIAELSLDELEHLLRGSDTGMYDENGIAGNAGIIGGTCDSLRAKGVPVLSTNDGFSGVRLQAHTALIPIATALAATFDTELVKELGECTAEEMLDCGSHIMLSPNVNIHRNPLCGRNFEYFSEDPLLSGKLGAAYILGLQSKGASATLKHLACNNQERGRHINDSRVSGRALREIYLRPFEIAVKESKPDLVMTSYNKLNGVYSCYNYDLATTLLRKQWGYEGCVVTDWWMSYGSSPDFKNVDLQAYRVRAQVDVFMPGSAKFGKYKGKSDGSLIRSLNRGGIKKGEIQRCAANILKLCLKHSKKNEEK